MIDGVSMVTPTARCKSCVHGRIIDWDLLREDLEKAGFSDEDIQEYHKMYGPLSTSVWCDFHFQRRPLNDYCPEWTEGKGPTWPVSMDEFETQFPAIRSTA